MCATRTCHWKRKLGGRWPWSLSATCIGWVKKMIQCNIRDITARKQADEVIRQQVKLQEQIAQIAATVLGMIFSFELRPDGSTRIPYASGALKTIF